MSDFALPAHALTKAEHDAIAERLGRPLTQAPPQRRKHPEEMPAPRVSLIDWFIEQEEKE